MSVLSVTTWPRFKCILGVLQDGFDEIVLRRLSRLLAALLTHCSWMPSRMVGEAWWQLLKTQPLLGAQGAFISMCSTAGWAKILYSCRTVPLQLQKDSLGTNVGCRCTAFCTAKRDGGIERKASSTSLKERDLLLTDVAGDGRTSCTRGCFVLQHTKAGQRPWTMPLGVLY